MRHFLVHWHHDVSHEPVWMAYEVTDDLAVPRKVEHFPDGRTECSTAAEEGWASLVHGDFDVDVPDSDKFTFIEIGADEFERRWASQ